MSTDKAELKIGCHYLAIAMCVTENGTTQYRYREEKTMINNAIRNAIECALFNCTDRERQFAAEYIELNPADNERRNRDADLVILGIMSMYHEIKRQLGEE